MVEPVVTKSRWTTEFFLTLATFLVSGLCLTGVISMDNQDYLGAVAQRAVEVIALVSGQTVVAYKYFSNRRNEHILADKEAERQHERHMAAIEPKPEQTEKKSLPKKRGRPRKTKGTK